METLKELRNEVKKLGYKIQTESVSFGRNATFVHVETGDKLTYNVFTPKTFERWKPLFVWGNKNKELLQKVKTNEGVYGLTRIISN